MSAWGYVLLGVMAILLAGVNNCRGVNKRKLRTIKMFEVTYRGISGDLRKLNELINDELSPLEIYRILVGTADMPPREPTFLSYAEHFATWTVTDEFEAHEALVEMRTELERLQKEALTELLSAIDIYGPYIPPTAHAFLIKKNG